MVWGISPRDRGITGSLPEAEAMATTGQFVLAPNSVQESADLIGDAFDLADKYLHPVIIASDAAIGQMMEAVCFQEMKEDNIDKFDWSVKGCRPGDKQRIISNVCFYGHPDYGGLSPEQSIKSHRKTMNSGGRVSGQRMLRSYWWPMEFPQE